MIETIALSKSFGPLQALDDISLTIKKASVFGLVGTNGAGKSTLLRLLAGILKADRGEIRIDGAPVFEQPESKQRFFYISDDQFYFSNSTPLEMARFYASYYKKFSLEQFQQLLHGFQLAETRKINTFSKGMKKQLAIALAIAANCDYIFCDETFDGLDPVMRQAVKSIFADRIAERQLTPIIASHNLRELEDICDQVGLLHQGGMLLARDLEDLKLSVSKVQVVFREGGGPEQLAGLELISQRQSGALQTLFFRNPPEQISSVLNAAVPIYMEILPLTLEEVFICETEVVGYDVKSLLR